MRRRWWVLALLVGVGVTATLLAATGSSDDVRWATVQPGTLAVEVEVTGSLEAIDSVLLGPPQAATSMHEFKVSFMAPEGMRVPAGMPVLRFDTSQLQQRREELSGQVQEAAKELERRRAELDKERLQLTMELAEAEARLRKASFKADVPEELAAGAELEKAVLDRRLAEQQVEHNRQLLEVKQRLGEAELAGLERRQERAAARLTEIDGMIDQMSVSAPKNGTVIYVADRGNEKIKIGDTVWRGRKVLQIPDLTRMRGTGQVDEADVGRIAVGQQVRLTLSAHQDVEYRGTLSKIGLTVQRRGGSPVKQVAVEIALDSTDPERMRPGMRFTGSIQVERAEDALVVPAGAVRPTAEGPLVIRRTLMGEERVYPRLGRWGGGQVEVLEGLADGDQVRIAGGGEE